MEPALVRFVALAAALAPARAATQAEVLSYLYRTTNGHDWKDSTNWLVGDPCTPGAGWMSSSYYDCVTGELTDRPQPVCCEVVRAGAETLEVVTLDLYHNNLVGTIPPELAQLPYLRMLVLDENSLSGTMPSEIGKLIDLTTLWVQYNSLSGSLPGELGKLAKIVDHGCYLHNNSFAPISCSEATDAEPDVEPLNLPPPCLTPYSSSPTGYLGEFDIPCASVNGTAPPPPPGTYMHEHAALSSGLDGGVVVALSIVGGAAVLVILNELMKLVRQRLAAREAAMVNKDRPDAEMNEAEREADEHAKVAHQRSSLAEARRSSIVSVVSSTAQSARDAVGRGMAATFTHAMSDGDSSMDEGTSADERTDSLSSASASEGRSRRGKPKRGGGRARFDGHV